MKGFKSYMAIVKDGKVFCCASKTGKIWGFPVYIKEQDDMSRAPLIDMVKEKYNMDIHPSGIIYRDANMSADVCWLLSDEKDINSRDKFKWVDVIEMDKVNWSEDGLIIADVVREKLQKQKYTICVDKEDIIDGHANDKLNYNDIKESLEVICSKVMSRYDAEQIYYNKVDSMKRDYETNTIKKFRTIHLYDENGDEVLSQH